MNLMEKIFGSDSDDGQLLSTQCLLIISENNGIELKDLAHRTGLSLSTTSRIVSSLTQNKKDSDTAPFVKEVVCSGREKHFYLTESGLNFLESLNEVKLPR